MSAAYAVGTPAAIEAATIANIETDFMMSLPAGDVPLSNVLLYQ
jgi:hypothetical protein